MKAKLILRIASVIMFLHLLGHMVGATTWKTNPDATVQETIKGMTEHSFVFMGAKQTLAGHHEGYGYAGALALLFFSIILWIISNADAQTKSISSKIVLVLSTILLLWGIDELIYFFPFAAAFSLISSVLGFYSLTLLKKLQ
ncbi:hypothetical protein FW774_10905 [Pedobacter sp. BS3]|uniref:LIC_13387 family protein n=1 Tax=Pedobacter sp. BS3 TaxID=2567937 RepID=UPI0011EECB2D|nr:hypothetical protein [Pedobacter sp. BS3]TZF83951.1 hypothetical protein FW774_10905 [Pedobacter sp. BS3]